MISKNRVLGFIFFLCVIGGINSWAQENHPLNNHDVTDMVSMGLSDSVIVAKIHNTPSTNFDTSIEALKQLKSAQVSNEIISAMINPASTVVTPTPSFTPPPPAVPGFPGNATVAYKPPTGSLIVLDQCPPPSVKGSGMGKMLLTQGLSGSQSKSVYRGAEAPLRIQERRPTFYIRSGARASFYFVRVEKKKDHREVETGRIGFHTGTGFKEQDRIEVAMTQVADGIQSVTPAQDLADGGEYLIAFDENGAIAFDFGIAPAK